MDARKSEKAKSELSWNGFRKFRIDRKVKECGDICSLYLVPHDGKALPPFLPGQYLTFEISISETAKSAGGKGPNAKPVIRCYSLSDSPTQSDYYRVTIKKIPSPPGKPELSPGLVSGYFHDHLKEGDIVDVKAPAGHFYLDLTKQTPVVLIAGGVGVTPVLSMLNTIIRSTSAREVWFFFGVRNRTEHIMKEHLERIALENPNVHLNVCYSNPTSDDVAGKDYHHGERVSVDLFKKLLPSNNYRFYICGPPPMMNQITQDLMAWGVPEQSILFEAFGPATVKKLAPAQPLAQAPEKAQAAFQVTFAKSGKTLAWQPEAGSLLDFATQNGITIDSGCRAGNCGTCRTAVKSGEVSYLVESGAKPEAGSCLTCISVPKNNLTLDA
jgi:ferredoxin-NADP reductase